MVRTELYRRVRGLSQAETARKFDTYPVYPMQFGLAREPTQQTISRTWAERFDADLKRVIEAAATGIRQVARDRGEFVHLLPEDEASALGSDPNEADNPDGDRGRDFSEAEINRTIGLARDVAFEPFDSGRAENATYDDVALMQAQAYLGMDGSGTPQLNHRFRHFSDREAVPAGDTHLRTVKRFGTSEATQATIDDFVPDDHVRTDVSAEHRAVLDHLMGPSTRPSTTSSTPSATRWHSIGR